MSINLAGGSGQTGPDWDDEEIETAEQLYTVLEEEGPLTPSDIALELSLGPNAAVRYLKGMQASDQFGDVYTTGFEETSPGNFEFAYDAE